MSDESFQEKTEAPTPKKRRDAREKGEVPKSQEVTTAFLLLAGAVVVQFGAPVIGSVLSRSFRYVTQRLEALPVGVEGHAQFVAGIGWTAVGAMAPVILALGATALLVTGVQGRGVLTVKPLQPQLSRINPLKNAKRMWGVQAIAQFAKSILKLVIIGAVLTAVVQRAMDDVPTLAQQGPHALGTLFTSYAVRILASAGGAYLFLALADYAFQVWQHERQLKMSREELRKEQKEMEGDQVMKVRRRTMGRQLARRRMLLAVSEADVVITNPTHLAIALKYDPNEASAPVVLAMGARKMAFRIREIAKANGVAIVENKPLARALWATARVGLPIPVELYVAVAEVLAFVIRTRRSRRPWTGNEVI